MNRGAGEVGLASAVLSLPASLIVPPFGALPMPAVGGAPLLNPSGDPTGQAAISLTAIATGTDEEEAATRGSVAKELTKREFRGG